MARGGARLDSATLIREFSQRLNRGDVAEALELCTDDCEYRTTLAPERPGGKEELRGFFEEHLRAWPERREEVRSIVVARPDVAAAELRLDGTFRDVPVSVDYLTVFDVRDGRISRVRVYGDSTPQRRAMAR